MEELREKIASALGRIRWPGFRPDRLGLELLHGDASARRYVRLHAPEADGSRVAMILAPEKARFSEEVMAGAEPGELPFINVHRYLDRIGVRVPHIHLVDEQLGVVILEDLGDQTLERRLVTADLPERRALYERAVDLLVHLQTETSRHPEPACVAYSRAFEVDLLRWELDHFLEYLVRVDRGGNIEGEDREILDGAFDRLATEIASWPRGFVHRDFQSRNLMFKGDTLFLIDFQDALLGPAAYDLVALLRDSYVELETELVEELIERYLQGCQRQGLDRPDPAEFHRQFDLLTLQRKMKDAGRFVFIERVKHNPAFLPFVPASLGYVARAFDRLAELQPCRRVLARAVAELEEAP